MMRIVISWLVLLAVVLIVVGFYRGWFGMSSDRDTQTNQVDVNLSIDPDKMSDDAETVKGQAKSLTKPAKR